MRIKYVGIISDEILEIVQEKTSNQLKVESSPMLQAISNARHLLMSNHYRDELATKDFALHTYESWIDFWYKCLSHLKEGQKISCDVVLDLSRERLGKTHQAMSKKVLEKELQEQLQFYSEHRDEALDMMDNFDEDTIHSCVVMFKCLSDGVLFLRSVIQCYNNLLGQRQPPWRLACIRARCHDAST